MARKREERAIRNAQRAARKATNAGQGAQDPNFVSLKQQLVAMGLTLRLIPGDGNCLFRALGDQLDGTPNTHQKHRQDVVAYMRQHRNDFEPFVEDDVPFERHLSNLAELGTYAGNDCIVAFARLHQVVVVIHQLNAPLWQISGSETKKSGMPELHISYHNGDHYNSVRRIGDSTASPASIKLTVQESLPGSSTAVKEKKKNKKKSMGAGAEDGCWDGDEEYGSWAADGDCTGDYWDDEEEPGALVSDCSEPVYEAPSKAEHMVMEQTGCRDLHLIRKHLEAHDFDVQQATEAIINFIILQHRGSDDCREPVKESPTQAEQIVMEQTGCRDLHLVRKYLQAHDFDVQEATEGIINFIIHQCRGEHQQTTAGSSGGLWSPNGTGTRLFGDNAAAPSHPHPHPQAAIHPSYQKKTQQEKIQQRLKAAQPHISNSKRKELKKQLRKQQALDRKRQNNGQTQDDPTSSDDSEVIIVKDIGCLSI